MADTMERKIFWIVVSVLGLLAATFLPLWWAVAATFPIVLIACWAGYQSPWLRRHLLSQDRPSDSQHDTTDKHAA